jgi:O-antigen/teichoic acid export membrane protein
LYTNLYSLVLGRKYTALDVGYYNQASLSSRFPSVSLMAIISRAIYPIQCKIQDDHKLLSSSFFQYLRISCYIIFPIMIGMAVLAKPLVLVLLSDKWINMHLPLSILCFAYIFIPLMMMNNQILNVKGRSDYFLKSEIVKKVAGILILLLTIPFGLIYICFGMLIYNICDVLIIISYSKKVISTGYIIQFKSILPIFFLAIIMGFIVYLSLFITNNSYLQLLFGSLIGAFFYIYFSKIFCTKEFDFLLSNLKKLIKTS